MNKRNTARKRPEEPPEHFELIGGMEAVSSTDQTGLVASAPVTEEEYEAYNEILPFSPKYFR